MNASAIWSEQRARTAPVCILLAAAGITLFGLALAEPWMTAHGHIGGALLVRKLFSAVCHQDVMRSFWFWGSPAAVCARCLGIYLGSICGVFADIQRKFAIAVLMTTLLANLADALTELAGWHGNLPQIRFALGVMLGVSISAAIVSAARRMSS